MFYLHVHGMILKCITEEHLGDLSEKNDDKRKIYGLTCNHIFPTPPKKKPKKLAYTNALNGFKVIG